MCMSFRALHMYMQEHQGLTHVCALDSGPYTCMCTSIGALHMYMHKHQGLTHVCVLDSGPYTYMCMSIGALHMYMHEHRGLTHVCMYTVSQCEQITSSWKVLTNEGGSCLHETLSCTQRGNRKSCSNFIFNKGSPKPAGLLISMRKK